MHLSRRTMHPDNKTKNDQVEHNRIQRLLASEYREFSDTILVESPFAETARDGRGIRQVSLGLTPSKLIVAADIFDENSQCCYPRGVDPSTESFELISVYPIEYVNLSIFRRRRCKTLKARFIDGKVRYYELGGTQRRSVVWKIWCDQVEKILAERMDGSSLSESTAASSTSTSTLYLLSSEIEIWKDSVGRGKKTVCRVWAHYGGAGDCAPPTWPKKDLYLGPSHQELISGQYAPVPVRFAGASLDDVKDELKDYSENNVSRPCRSWPTYDASESEKKSKYKGGLCDVLFVKNHDRASKILPICPISFCDNCGHRIYDNSIYAQERSPWSPKESKRNAKKNLLSRKISRFGFGVPEKCNSGLVLGPCRGDKDYRKDLRSNLDPRFLTEHCVRLWESAGKRRSKQLGRNRHLRRYGLSTATHFLYALGPWSVQPGERDLFQCRRSCSLVNIRRQATDPELRLPVSRRQLKSSISCTALKSEKIRNAGTTTRGQVVLFWTPDYWYRPRPAAAAYRELRQHLSLLKDFQQEQERQVKRRMFHRRRKHVECEDKGSNTVVEEKPSRLFGRIFLSNDNQKKRQKERAYSENDNTKQLRRLLKMDFRITVWDLDSSTLATQLTLIDRELFVRVPVEEIQTLIYEKTSKNASNLGAWIAFSHRISCLTASEILAIKNLEMRARITARFINVANKCFTIGNFQSCRSVIAGLQAPPIYRLKSTWSHLRTHHANRYETMGRLCKIFKSSCSSAYRRAWAKAERNSARIPYVGDLLTRILNLNNKRPPKNVIKHYHVINKTSRERGLRSNTSSYKNIDETTHVKTTPKIVKQRQTFARRLFSEAFAKIRFRRNRKVSSEKAINTSSSSRQQDLERKYFHRWYNIALKSKLLAKERERWRNADPIKKQILDVASWLTDCQRFARGYSFPVHSFACEFLLKARYREDRENFIISQKLEPPQVT